MLAKTMRRAYYAAWEYAYYHWIPKGFACAVEYPAYQEGYVDSCLAMVDELESVLDDFDLDDRAKARLEWLKNRCSFEAHC